MKPLLSTLSGTMTSCGLTWRAIMPGRLGNTCATRSRFQRACAFIVVALGTFAITFGPAQAVVVNISAYDNGANSPVIIFLDAGTYSVTPIAPPTSGALYTAWNPRTDPPNVCDAGTGICTNNGWINDYQIKSLDTGDLPLANISDGTYYQSDVLAFAHALSFQFTLPTAQRVGFNVGDTFIIDNSGGISLEVSAVPLPTALPLFATGLGAVGLLGWRRKRKRKHAA